MDWHMILLAASQSWTFGDVASTIGRILAVVVGLGLVIFVHELGHFAVAKWCGVKCDKFYLGFDFWGKKLFSFQYGETEYGIGLFPLGGYVKMLGQDDNPSNQAEEVKRSQLSGTDAGPGTIAPGEEPPLDPRSYLAKSVPQRMAIISAGVIMNIIFAFFVFGVAAWRGVDSNPPEIGETIPGDPGWAAGIRSGDRILSVGGRKAVDFEDIRKGLALGNSDSETGKVDVSLERLDPAAPNGKRVIDLKIKPKKTNDLPMMGLAPQVTLTLYEKPPVADHTPAKATNVQLQGGDVIVAVGDRPVKDFTEFQSIVGGSDPKDWLRLTVERTEKPTEGAKEPTKKTIQVNIDKRPRRVVGLEMAMGPIREVRVGSPAAEAGIKAGDVITLVNDQPIGDPLSLPTKLQALAGQKVSLSVQTNDKVRVVELQSTKDPRSLGELMHGVAVELPTLGIAYQIQRRVAAVAPNSPAAKLEQSLGKKFDGAQIVSAQFILEKPKDDNEISLAKETIDLTTEGKSNSGTWLAIMNRLQTLAPSTKLKLTTSEGTELLLDSVESTDSFLVDRGLILPPKIQRWTAAGIGDAASFASEKTVDNVFLIVRVLQKLVRRDLPASTTGGPIKVFYASWRSTERSASEFLVFLGVLSVNLAVINFLPIPVLDGGHFLFLLIEGFRGKKANERVTLIAHVMGLSFILCLVLFVLVMDLQWVATR